jgi:hypothetical protein
MDIIGEEKKRKKRWVPTKEQSKYLMRQFIEHEGRITNALLEEFARNIDTTVERCKNFFANHRSALQVQMTRIQNQKGQKNSNVNCEPVSFPVAPISNNGSSSNDITSPSVVTLMPFPLLRSDIPVVSEADLGFGTHEPLPLSFSNISPYTAKFFPNNSKVMPFSSVNLQPSSLFDSCNPKTLDSSLMWSIPPSSDNRTVMLKPNPFLMDQNKIRVSSLALNNTSNSQAGKIKLKHITFSSNRRKLLTKDESGFKEKTNDYCENNDINDDDYVVGGDAKRKKKKELEKKRK